VSAGILAFSPAVSAQTQIAHLATRSTSSGGGWSVASTPDPQAPSGELSDVACPSSESCEAVGAYINSVGDLSALAEGWNGEKWALQPVPGVEDVAADSLSSVACASIESCEAVGNSKSSSNAESLLAELWNGTKWTLQTVPKPSGAVDSVLTGVACISTSDCETVGDDSKGVFAEKWNGTKWAVQTAAQPKGSYATFDAVTCTSKVDCEAVGNYSTSSGDQVGLAEIWSGSTWSLQNMADPSGGSQVLLYGVSCPSSTSCEAVGNYYTSSGEQHALAEAWDGTNWTLQSSVNPSASSNLGLQSVSCISASDCEASGFYYGSGNVEETMAEVWNGTIWTMQTTTSAAGGTKANLDGVVCTSASGCEAVGAYADSSGQQVTIADSWNGTSWGLQDSVNGTGAAASSLIAVACPSATDCEAVGDDAQGAFGEGWNGSAWTVQPVPAPSDATGSGLNGVACPTASDCEAVGYYDTASSEFAMAELWNGTNWALQSVPIPSKAISSELYGVACVSSSDCEAVGLYYNSSDEKIAFAFEWNGTDWAQQALPSPKGFTGSEVLGIDCQSPTDCEAVGSYSDSQTYSHNMALEWNGSDWALQSAPDPSGSAGAYFVSIACRSSGYCEAVGTTLGVGYTKPLAEVWNGTSWSLQSVSKPAYGILYGVACPSSSGCEATGQYLDKDNATAPAAESWDGSSWVRQIPPDPTQALYTWFYEVACPSPSSCLAVGTFTNVSSDEDLALVEDWNS
jgi:hypothetical protein